MQSIPANEIFQKVDARQIGMMVRFYRAADVDALLADVRRLIEAAKTARTFLINRNLVTIAYRVDMQIAAVERHLLKE